MHPLSVISNLAGRTMRKRDGWWLNLVMVALGKVWARKHWQQQNPRRRASVEVEEAGPPEDTQFRVSKVVSERVINCMWKPRQPSSSFFL